MSDNTDKQLTLHIKEFTPEMIFPTTEQMYEPKSWGTKMVVLGKPACFERGTKVLMFDGKLKNIENIEVGDYVMGDDSTKRKVLSLSHGIDTMYKIIPKIGDPITVNSHHIITVVKIKGNNKGQIIDISLDEYLKLSPKARANYNWIRVPVQFEKQTQHIEPYILGFFIDGDYSFVKREFIKKHYQITDEIIDKLIESNIPIIPDSILYSDVNDRAEYLAGMLDAKATYNTTTKRFDLPVPSEELCDQVMYLAGSIGYYNSKIKNYKCNFFTQTQQLVWSCYIYVNTNTLIKSKMFDINYIKTMFNGMFTTDFYVLESGIDEYFGFRTDGNQRFLLGDFSITHNSGKCMGKGTPIIKFDGSICPIEDIKKGDLLLGDDSYPREVLKLYRGHGDLYKIKQNKGHDYIVNSEHILTLYHSESGKVKDVCIQDVIKSNERYYGIKNVFNWRYKRPVEIEPYKYGCSLDFEHIDLYIFNEMKIRYLYLQGLIQGLRGEFNRSNANIVINIEKYKELLPKFEILIYSLGFNAVVSRKHKTLKIWISGKYIYNLNHYLPGKCYLPWNLITKTPISIIPYGQGDYYGFELSGNKRYTLGGDCTITHNTFAITSLLYQKRHIFPFGMVFSGTEKVTGYWSKIFPDSFVYPNLQLSKVTDFLKQQELNKKHLQNPWSVLLIDDCAFETKLFNSELFKELFQNGRHYKFWLILSLQYPSNISPCLRQNIDYTFIYKNNNINERKKIYENYASVIPSFNLFCAIMDQITNDYTALVINNLSQNTDFQECIFWYKAPPFPEDFKFGSIDYWNHHYVRYNGQK